MNGGFAPTDGQEEQLAQLVADSGRKLRLYETFLDNSPDLAYVFDLNHRFVYANRVLLQMWSKTWDEAIGKNCLELGYEPWHADMHSREIELAIATRRPVRGEVPFNGSFGRRIYDYIFVPVIGPDGEVEAIAGTTRDVTERKQTEESLREANRRKDEFLAMLAHELRNPLAPISAAAELLKVAGEDKDRVERASEIISRQVTHMTSLVDDLLDVSRVTRGLVDLDQRRVNIETVIHSAIEQVRPMIESRQHTLSTRLPFGKTAVCGDKVRLVQVLSNVLNNAAKYTPPGGEIALDVQADQANVRISVRDNGIGMEAALLPRVFDLFSQAERSSDRAQGGLGLGLALAKSIVELHGGRIQASSDGAGCGSCFEIELPIMNAADSAVAETPRQAAPGPDRNSLRLMIVDDNEDAAGSLAALMQIEGHEVMVQTDPHGALLCASRQAPQVCILDIGLPSMNGHELARELRRLPGTQSAVLIALSGYGQASDRALAEAAGFNHYFVKPVDPASLAQVLRRL